MDDPSPLLGFRYRVLEVPSHLLRQSLGVVTRNEGHGEVN